MKLEGEVYDGGIRVEGSPTEMTFSRNKAARVIDELADAAKRGEVFFASVAVAGVDHAASFTTTAPFAVYNPEGSGVELELIAVSMGYVSGTLGAGFLGLGRYCQDSLKVIPSGTLCVARGSNRLSDPAGGSGDGMKAVPLETVTLTAGTVLVTPVCDIAPKLATTAGGPTPSIFVLPFPIVVPERVAAVLAGVCGAAGTTPRVTLGAFWRERKKAA